jgi:hypothetical protein
VGGRFVGVPFFHREVGQFLAKFSNFVKNAGLFFIKADS